MSPRIALVSVVVVVALGALAAATGVESAFADETSTGDKQRILYSSRFTFTDDGLPLITVEIMGGQREIRLSAPGGVIVRPDGDGGSAIEVDGGQRWVVRGADTRPATIREWTVVERLSADDAAGAAAATERWAARGHAPRSFEIGTVFGVEGEVIDTREVLIAIDPVAAPGGSARARALAERHGVETSVHRELLQRPGGTIVAASGATTIRNPSVLWFAPRRAGDTISVEDVPVGTGGSQLETTRETRRYWGSVYVTVDATGALVAANAVAEDKLLAGLVPAEIFPDAPEAALDAQAIAARTELLEKIGRRNLTDPFLLCSTQQCQVYAGAGKEHPRTTAAVTRTRGKVLLRDGGGLVDVRYSASAGGHTEDNDVIWGGAPDPSLRGAVDGPGADVARFRRIDDGNLAAFLDDEPGRYWSGRTARAKGRFRWQVEVAAGDLDALVAAQYPKVGHIVGLEPLTRSAAGRIRKLKIRGAGATVVVAGDLAIRRLLGGLKSTLFLVTRRGPADAPTGWLFRGAGFGHGVGMCQVGAIGMAEAGKRVDDILTHYYRGTHVRRLY